MAVMFRKAIKIQELSTDTDFCGTAVCHISLMFHLKTKEYEDIKIRKKEFFY